MKFTSISRKGLSMVMAAVMTCGMLPAAAEEASVVTTPLPYTVSDAVISAAMETADDAEEVQYADDEIVRVSIFLEGEPTISRYSAEGISTNASAKAYRAQIEDAQKALAETISDEVLNGEALDVVTTVSLIGNFISANVEYGQMEAIKAVEGVKDVCLEPYYTAPEPSEDDEIAQPNTGNTGSMIGSTIAYSNGYTGAGARIAIVDTGTDTDHQSFSGDGWAYSMAQNAKEQGVSEEEYLASMNLLTVDEIAEVLDQLNVKRRMPNVTAEQLYYNGKQAFNYNYVDNNLDVTHDNDSQGEHGSHVAGIATANKYIANEEGGYDLALEAVYAQGVAPDAQLLTMKVFGRRGGAYNSDYFNAIEDAIILKADTVNLSLGSSSPGFSSAGNYQSIYEALKQSTTIATISSGNNGHWSENAASGIGLPYLNDISFQTDGSPGSYTDSTTVASIDNVGFTGNYFVTNGKDHYFYNESLYSNEPMTSIAGEYEYIFVDESTTEADWDAVGDEIKGRIAICGRGGGYLNLSQKSNEAVEHGAIATIIHYDGEGSMTMNLGTYLYTNPSVSITKAEGYAIRDAGEQRFTADGVSYHVGKITIAPELLSDHGDENASPEAGYKMSEFTSWGAPGSLQLKPEITAPGGNIWSVNGAIAGGQAYENMSGTSMAAPHMAGMGAVVGQRIRKDGLAELTGYPEHVLKNALLTSTSVPVNEDQGGVNYYYSVMRQGGGLANVGNATIAKSLILMKEGSTSGYEAGKVKAEVGEDAERTGVYHFGFTITNMSDEDLDYTFNTEMFTQAKTTINGVEYLDTKTTPVEAIATYTVDGEEFKPTADYDADITNDGVTNVDDAKAILAAVVNKDVDPSYNWEVGDVDGDGDLTTYDAHLILMSIDENAVTVKADETVDVEVEVAYTDAAKAKLDAEYPRGAYVEGFTFIKPATSIEDDIVADVEYSIPIFGFYGNLTDPNMFEEAEYADIQYGDYRPTYTGNIGTNMNNVRLNYNGSNYYFAYNPYAVEETKPEGRYISSNARISQVNRGAIRPSAQSNVFITKGDEVLYDAIAGSNTGAYWNDSNGVWSGSTSNINMGNLSLNQYGLEDGDEIAVNLVSLPEYYTIRNGGQLSGDQVRSMIADGSIGIGAQKTYRFTIDDTMPEVLSVSKSTSKDIVSGEVTYTLDVSAQDNNGVAYIALYSSPNANNFSRITGAVPTKDENGVASVSFDTTNLNVPDTCYVLIGDYAMNQTILEVAYVEPEPEPTADPEPTEDPGNEAVVEAAEREAEGL